MNAIHAVLWTLVASFPLAILIAALPWLARLSSPRKRRVLSYLLALVLLAPLSVSTASGLYLWLAAGLDDGPWLGASLAWIAQAAGSAWLVRNSERVARWPRVPFAVGVPLCAVLLWTVGVNLGLSDANQGLAMQLEAGRIAHRETPPPVEPADNAAPLYVALREKLVGQASAPNFRAEWLNRRADLAALAPLTSEARTALAKHAAELAELHASTRLAHCVFAPLDDRRDDEHDRLSSRRVTALSDFGRILVLEARVRASDGDAGAALEALAAVMRLADHAEETPTLIAMMTAVSMRDTAIQALPMMLGAGSLSRHELERIPLDPRRDPLEVHERAFWMEEAYFLDALGRANTAGGLSFALMIDAPREWLESPGAYLALRLCFDAQVDGYRRALAGLRGAMRLAPEALRARLETPVPAHERYRDGVLAGLFAPKLDAILRSERRAKAMRELARSLVRAAIIRAEHGAFPTSAEDLGVLPAGVRWEGDATQVRFTLDDPIVGKEPLELALPTPATPTRGSRESLGY